MSSPEKPANLSDLPKWSPWPARLLGLAKWTLPSRTLQKIEQEYDREKYAALLEYASGASPEQIRRHAVGDPEAEIVVSRGDDLLQTTCGRAGEEQLALMETSLAPALASAGTVVELGAGYGFNLWYLKRRHPELMFVGGEYSQNAVRLAGEIYRGVSGLEIRSFNYYQAESYAFLRDCRPPLLIFTSHSIEQLPTAEPALNALMEYRGHIMEVVHLEPIAELHSDSLLGLMRQRYAIINDYNRDLLTRVRGLNEARILEVRPDVFGWNPLNPTSVLRWRFN